MLLIAHTDGPEPPTPQDCVVEAWSAYGTCSQHCFGARVRTRGPDTPATGGGSAASCAPLWQEQECSADDDCGMYGCCCVRERLRGSTCASPCLHPDTEPVDCQVSAWSSWDACTASCGGGTQSRSRTVLQQPANGGAACGDTSEIRPCNTHECPGEWSFCRAFGSHAGDTRCCWFVNASADDACVWGQWSEWTSCSAVCDGGSQVRVRSPSSSGCVGALSQERTCNSAACPDGDDDGGGGGGGGGQCSSCWFGTSGPCQSVSCAVVCERGSCSHSG